MKKIHPSPYTQIFRVLIFKAMIVYCVLLPATQAIAENRALLIGVGQYEMGIRLPGIESDIRHMKRAALLMGFKENQVKVLLNQQATLDGITQAVREWLVKGVTSQDRVLFYFTGHGSQIADKNNDETDGADEVLLPYDTVFENKTLQNVLVDETFDTILDNIPAKIVIVFLDACHSGTATRKVFEGQDGFFPKFLEYPGMPETNDNTDLTVLETDMSHRRYIALSACRDDEEALSSKKGSLLTQGILSALDEAVLLGRGLTMDEFKTKTSRFIAKSLALSKRTQRPQITGNISLAGTYIINNHQENLWEKLETLALDATFTIPINAQKKLLIDDLLVISCKTDRLGYLNIVFINADEQEAMVLFPNRFHPNNRLNKNASVMIPEKEDQFVLRAQPPAGKSMILAIHTRAPINLFAEGVGDHLDNFKKLSKKSLEDIVLQKKTHPTDFGAGVVVTEIFEK